MGREPRLGKRRAKQFLFLGLSVVVAYLHRIAASFVLGFGRPNQLGHACLRVARAARGGEADSFSKGDVVKAICPDDDMWYPGVIESLKDDKYVVKWDDPEDGPETHVVSEKAIKKIFKDYKVGEAVYAIFPDDPHDNNYYPGEVMKINDDATFTVKWEYPDGGPDESNVEPTNMKYPPIPLEELKFGQKYTGTVTAVFAFGAFVDIGAEKDGLVHISKIAPERVEKGQVHSYLQVGQEVEAWMEARRDDGSLALTMVKGRTRFGGMGSRPADLAPFERLSPTDWFDGVVVKTASFGAFVTVTLEDGAFADGLVRIAELKDGFVQQQVDDEVSVGQHVKVRVLSANVNSGKMALSMRRVSEQAQDLTPFLEISSNLWLTGTVTKILPFGAFVKISAEDGTSTEGMVHATQLSDGFVEDVEDEVSVGQEVQVRIESVDTKKCKISLSMRQPDVPGEF